MTLEKASPLDLGDNRLTTFDFVCLEKNVRLLVLDLQSNSITHIQTSLPVTKLNLEEVILSHNWLKVLSFDHFPDLPFLETFKEDGNRLTEIEYKMDSNQHFPV
jgi:Leucine-rich repeat (LRR) protein